jgi:hypothetical protein
MVAMAAGYFGLRLWAKRMGKFSTVQFYDVGQIKNRYESKGLNAGALFLSLVVSPIGGVIFALGLFDAFDTDMANILCIVGGLALTFSREYYMLLCDVFAKRTPTVA